MSPKASHYQGTNTKFQLKNFALGLGYISTSPLNSTKSLNQELLGRSGLGDVVSWILPGKHGSTKGSS